MVAALALWCAASELGCAASANNLGLMFERGIATTRADGAAALHPALGSVVESPRPAASSAEQTPGPPEEEPDYETAAAWCVQYNARENPQPVLTIDLVLYMCTCLAPPCCTFRGWLRRYLKAAERGEAGAQYNLGFLVERGKGVRQSNAEAAAWYRRAADAGFGPAQLCLGLLCERGHGVPQSTVEAAKWLRRAADQNILEVGRQRWRRHQQCGVF